MREVYNGSVPGVLQSLREGRTLYEYAAAVKTNARDYRQAQSGIKDFENIAREIVNYGKA